MSLKCALKLSVVTGFCVGSLFGDPVSFVGGFAGSFVYPGPGLTFSQTLPGSSSYSVSQPITAPGYSGTYSASATTLGTLTTATLSTSVSYSSGPPSTLNYGNLQYLSVNSYSGATISVNGPVYLSESVTLTYSGVANSSVGGPQFIEELEFTDGSGGNFGSGCTFGLNSALPVPAPGQQSTVSCSTGKVLISGAETISINNSLGAQVTVFRPGDLSSVQETATLGPLDVYDTSGTLIESINLNSLAAAPEPGCGFLLAIGLLAYGLNFIRLYNSATTRTAASAAARSGSSVGSL